MALRRRLLAVGLGALAAAAGLAACGEDDFENQPRPAAPIELTALVNDREVKVSPAREVGAGLATMTISNQSQDPAELTLEGPTDAASDPIPPGGVGSMKVELKQGDYTASAGPDNGARETQIAVGAPRESSQNELLLP